MGRLLVLIPKYLVLAFLCDLCLPIPGWQMSAIVLAGLLPLLTVPFHH
ncbi:MAG: hypothetical protein H7237_08885 [Alkalinema sp. FL-bin-369]|nr:hypothetical protein [Leptolyngbyaceae cyanobacterium LF-bin-369]